MKKQIFILLNLIAMHSLYSSDQNNQENFGSNVPADQAQQRFFVCDILSPVRDLNPQVEPASRGRSLSFNAEVELAVQQAEAAQEVPMHQDDYQGLNLEDVNDEIQEIADNHSEHNLEDFNDPYFSDNEDVLSVHSQDGMDYQDQ